MTFLKLIHKTLRPAFGVCLFLSQFISNRTTFFTNNIFIICLGIIILIAGILLLISASNHLKKTVNSKKITNTGPFAFIRHPIYSCVYILTTGLGLLFYSMYWFIVMLIFIPLWYIESREEERQMIKYHGEKYTDYQAKAKMFIPWIF
jgi:protein-S-isoprenylcysteine O-methyltransferase Ste14